MSRSNSANDRSGFFGEATFSSQIIPESVTNILGKILHSYFLLGQTHYPTQQKYSFFCIHHFCRINYAIIFLFISFSNLMFYIFFFFFVAIDTRELNEANTLFGSAKIVNKKHNFIGSKSTITGSSFAENLNSIHGQSSDTSPLVMPQSNQNDRRNNQFGETSWSSTPSRTTINISGRILFIFFLCATILPTELLK